MIVDLQKKNIFLEKVTRDMESLTDPRWGGRGVPLPLFFWPVSHFFSGGQPVTTPPPESRVGRALPKKKQPLLAIFKAKKPKKKNTAP